MGSDSDGHIVSNEKKYGDLGEIGFLNLKLFTFSFKDLRRNE